MKYQFLSILLCFLFNSCQKEISIENGAIVNLPTVTTTAVTSISTTTSVSGGDISSDGGAAVTVRGVCWGIATNPEISSSHTTDGTGTGTFISNITGLNSSTTYHVRAFATNSVGTAYGNDVSFTTLPTPGIALPTLTTTIVTSIAATSATSGGNITSDGGALVTVRGVCWSISPIPVVTGNHTTDGTGTGAFSSNITGLTANTVYYVRAYATNNAGTAYGNQVSFTTSTTATLPILSTTAISSITALTASSGGNISSDGGATVTVRGVCWSTTTNPVATGNHTIDGTGIGAFISSITNLTPSVIYYVRAYATNSVGTAYGNELSFTALTPDVYVAGEEWNATTSIAKVWKNGIATSLSNGVIEGHAHSTYVSGTDVYVGGVEGSTGVAKIWKNSIATTISSPPCGATVWSVLVSGADVYAATEEGDCFNPIAKIYKNGLPSTLSSGTYGAIPYSVYVSGTDVYAAGRNGYFAPTYIAMSWKNGVATSLTNGTFNAEANSIYVSGTDVFVAGYENNGTHDIAKLWKNGLASALTSGSNDADANSVCVSGTDVYIAGWEITGSNHVAKIWKNGVPTSLTDGTQDASAESVYVFGPDIYVAGWESNGTNDVVKVWKNGVAIPFTNGSFDATAFSIFVK